MKETRSWLHPSCEANGKTLTKKYFCRSVYETPTKRRRVLKYYIRIRRAPLPPNFQTISRRVYRRINLNRFSWVSFTKNKSFSMKIQTCFMCLTMWRSLSITIYFIFTIAYEGISFYFHFWVTMFCKYCQHCLIKFIFGKIHWSMRKILFLRYI